MWQYTINFLGNTLLHVSKKRIVAQAHELTQGCGQQTGFAARL
jgi:hypothetical protein